MGFSSAFAQMPDTLELTLSQAEEIFMENNLPILAQELNIDLAKAEIVQAKVWPLPSLSLEEVNLFSTKYQKEHAEEMNARFGKKIFNEYQQFSLQLEQMVELAGKRKKRQAIADVSAEQAEVYLEDFLLNLKTEFRKYVYDYFYHQEYLILLEEEVNSLKTIVSAYERQRERGNIDKGKIIRLRSSQMSLRDEIINQQQQQSDLFAELTVLLNIPTETTLVFSSVLNTEYNYGTDLKYTLSELQSEGLKKKPGLRIIELESDLLIKELDYEKSLGVPDLNLGVAYDRNSGIYPDFIGLGVSMDLPFTNPNKGNIQKAKIKIKQQAYQREIEIRRTMADIQMKYTQVTHLGEFLNEIDLNYIIDLDDTMDAYTRNFRTQSINILEYLDFLHTYIENKEAIIDKQRDYLTAIEELKYATGIDEILNN